MKKIIIILNIIIFMMVFTSAIHPDDRVVVPLSKPGQPCILKANLFSGGITVTGTNGKEVIVNLETVTRKLSGEKEGAIPEPPVVPDIAKLKKGELKELGTTRERAIKEAEELKGLKRIPNVSMDISIQEENNVVTIRSESMHHTVNLNIQVPYNTSLKLGGYQNGNIIASKVSGDLEIKNFQGYIQLNDISGSVVAETYNGYITAVFSGINSKTPMSFSTFHGKIDVTFPAGTKANLKMKSDHGDIYTDFDINIQSKSQKEEKRSESGKYLVTIEKGVYGAINGGGPEFYFKTYHGNIIIRKGK
jgi:hypothetical protein